MIIAVPPDKIDDVWPDIERLSKKFKTKFPETSDRNMDNIKTFLVKGKGILLTYVRESRIEACAVLEKSEKEGYMDITTVSGYYMDECFEDMLETTIHLSKELGFTGIKTMPNSRKGWKRFLRNYGFKPVEDHLERNILWG